MKAVVEMNAAIAKESSDTCEELSAQADMLYIEI